MEALPFKVLRSKDFRSLEMELLPNELQKQLGHILRVFLAFGTLKLLQDQLGGCRRHRDNVWPCNLFIRSLDRFLSLWIPLEVTSRNLTDFF